MFKSWSKLSGLFLGFAAFTVSVVTAPRIIDPSAQHKRSPAQVDFADPFEGKNIIGLELMVAAPYSGAIYSRWGHVLFRFVDDDNDWTNDIVVSFVADMKPTSGTPRNPTTAETMWKGLTGGYPLVPQIGTLGDFWVQYVRQEGRGLDRYILPTTPEMRQSAMATLHAWMKDPKKDGAYTFLNNNCAGGLFRFLVDAGFPTAKKAAIPSHMPKKLFKAELAIYPKISLQSPTPVFDQLHLVLKITAADVNSGEHWPGNSAELIVSTFTPHQIFLLLHELTSMPLEIRAPLVRYVKAHNATSIQNNEYFNCPAAAPSLYSACDNLACINQVLKDIKTTWPPAETLSMSQARKKLFLRIRPGNRSRSLLRNKQIYRHFELLETSELNPEHAEQALSIGLGS